MRPSALSGEDVARAGLSRRQASLGDRGEKLSEDDLASLDKLTFEQRLTAKYDEILEQLRRPFVVKRSELCYADWLDDVGVARASSVPAKLWIYMGVEVAGVKYLHREEALMLCDMGYLVLREDGHSLSMQQTYSRLLRHCSCRLRQYRVYAHLTRLGHRIRVRRNVPIRKINSASPEISYTAYEKKIRLDQYLSDGKVDRLSKSSSYQRSSKGVPVIDKSGIFAANSMDVSEHNQAQSSISANADTCMTLLDSEPPKAPHLEDALTIDSKVPHGLPWYTPDRSRAGSETHCSDRVSSAGETSSRCESLDPFSDWMSGHDSVRDDRGRFSRQFMISYGLCPAHAASDGRLKVRAPPTSLLPSGVVPNSHYFLRSSRDDATSGRQSRAASSKFVSHLPRLSEGALDWRIYKLQICNLYRSASDSNHPINQQSSDLSALPPSLLMRRLRVATPVAKVETSWQSWLYRRVIYDVYTPQQHFRKSQPPPPSCRVAVVSVEQQLGAGEAREPVCDCLADMWARPQHDDVPLRVAVVPETAEPAIYTATFGTMPVNSALTGWENALLRCCDNFKYID